MAFEKIYQFPDEVKAKVRRLEKRIESEPDRNERMILRREVSTWFNALTLFHQTVCATSKFKHQKVHCESVMRELEPKMTEYYLKPTRKGTK